MVDTGVRVRRAKFPSGSSLAVGLAIGLISLIVGVDLFLHPNISSSLLLPFTFGGVGVVILGIFAVPALRRLKAGQVIREDGPQSHLKKQGTPTMGGIFIIPVGILLGLVWSGFNEKVIACSLLTISFAFIGWLDDWKILRRHSNKGLSPRAKLLLQSGFSACFCAWCTGAIALFGMGLLLFPNNKELAIFCMCLSGSYLGFLWHNRYPAKVFMGDTGSLALGGALASTAILGNLLWAFLIVGAIFIWESISVIAQVSYYKATKDETGMGKRLFRMAPFHHHLELSGWHELHVVRAFYLTGGFLVGVALLISKL